MSCGERLVKELRRRGRRVTPQRAVILETIAHLSGHCSAQQVHQAASERLPGLNLATVYRTLETLQQDGLVDFFPAEPGQMRFALREEEHPHGHLVCSSCGAVLEFDPSLAFGLKDEIESSHQFQIGLEHLTLHGLCSQCSGSAP